MFLDLVSEMESDDEILQFESDEESIEEVQVEDDGFDYLLVQRSQLEAILTRRCVLCGKAKYERSTPVKRPRLSEHARKVIWKQRGANMTAMWTCSCYKKGKKYIRWSAQSYIEGTKTREGNVAVVAAAAFSATSSVESAHSLIATHYRTKDKYFPLAQFTFRTMLAAIAWNRIQDAELSGERQVVSISAIHSKARGTLRTKVRKTAGPDDWKKKLVVNSLEKKRLYGPGMPAANDGVEQLVDEVQMRLSHLTLFDEEEDASGEEDEAMEE